ncbi:hypothetical protein DCAR_0101617 [Daucus carota subsp. sativus]|uniref:Uncharacterized protein n=1 Tax=Daucus carota subsp. sativus TaxID=79200 RepID=A0A166GIH6_DAUCS|nr:hypothetical protein DCAR_0101617 [Daucus carota subsp. sativus]
MGIKFSAVLDLKISDGTGQLHVADDKKINVKGADWAVFCLAASSSFDGHSLRAFPTAFPLEAFSLTSKT